MIKTTFKIIGVGVVFGAVVATTIFLLLKIVFLKDASYLNQGMAAFTGAAAAFSFTILGSWLNQYRERVKRDYTALVRSEYSLNIYLNAINDNLSILYGARQAFSNQGFHILNFKNFSVDHSVLQDFRNIDLINEYVSLIIDFDRHDQAFETIELMFQDLKAAIFNKVLTDKELLRTNMNNMILALNDLEKTLKGLESRLEKALCGIRISAREEKPLMAFLYRKRYRRDHASKVAEEQKKLSKEREDVRKRSEEELKKMGISSTTYRMTSKGT